jgi:RNA polymerase sigma factor (sigma-70 family)
LRHLADVRGFVLRRVRDRELSADLTAEVFAVALQTRLRFDPRRGNARGWLRAIASNKIVDCQRRRTAEDACHRRMGPGLLALEDDDLGRVDEIAAASDAIGSSAQLLAGLPADTRAAVAARVLDEREYPEIAAELGCSVSAARKRVSRGLTSLRVVLGEDR